MLQMGYSQIITVLFLDYNMPYSCTTNYNNET